MLIVSPVQTYRVNLWPCPLMWFMIMSDNIHSLFSTFNCEFDQTIASTGQGYYIFKCSLHPTPEGQNILILYRQNFKIIKSAPNIVHHEGGAV